MDCPDTTETWKKRYNVSIADFSDVEAGMLLAEVKIRTRCFLDLDLDPDLTYYNGYMKK